MKRVKKPVALTVIAAATGWGREHAARMLKKSGPQAKTAMGRYSVYDLEEIAEWLGQDANDLQTIYSEHRSQAVL